MPEDPSQLRYPSCFVDTECTLLEIIAPTAFRAVLPNGKLTIAFLQRRELSLLPLLHQGTRVRVTICPADFDRARIRSLAS